MKLSVEEAFEILGVTKDSSEPDIKDAYRYSIATSSYCLQFIWCCC